MNRYNHAVRRPVRRPSADAYLLIILLSFALSISFTRLFLALTGYPQLGGEQLHISHVLWGGLLLFIAALLPLILANRWVYKVVAILAGVGIGLFIDEVGKFITQNYDYFFPPAAPIVYAFFLICVLVYIQLSRPRQRHSRSELYAALEMMEDVLDRDLDAQERTEIRTRLRFVIDQADNPDLSRLASELLNYFESDQIFLAPNPPGRLQKFSDSLQAFESRFLNRNRMKNILVIGLASLGLISIIVPIRSLLVSLPLDIQAGIVETIWYLSLQVIQLLAGLTLLLAAALLATGREHKGINIGYFTLLVYLTIIDIFLFYYFQFAMILVATIQFMIFLGVLYYDRRYLRGKSAVQTDTN